MPDNIIIVATSLPLNLSMIIMKWAPATWHAQQSTCVCLDIVVVASVLAVAATDAVQKDVTVTLKMQAAIQPGSSQVTAQSTWHRK